MKETLVYKAILPIAMAMVYLVVTFVSATDEPAYAVMTTSIFTFVIGFFMMSMFNNVSSPLGMLAHTAATVLAMMTVFVRIKIDSNYSLPFDILLTATEFTAVLAAIMLKKHAGLRSSELLLIFYSVSWVTSIGFLFFFFAISAFLKGGIALAFATALPLLLLWHEKRKERAEMLKENGSDTELGIGA